MNNTVWGIHKSKDINIVYEVEVLDETSAAWMIENMFNIPRGIPKNFVRDDQFQPQKRIDASRHSGPIPPRWFRTQDEALNWVSGQYQTRPLNGLRINGDIYHYDNPGQTMVSITSDLTPYQREQRRQAIDNREKLQDDINDFSTIELFILIAKAAGWANNAEVARITHLAITLIDERYKKALDIANKLSGN